MTDEGGWTRIADGVLGRYVETMYRGWKIYKLKGGGYAALLNHMMLVDEDLLSLKMKAKNTV